MKIVLFGAGGQVGKELRGTLQPLGELVAFGHAEADFTRPGGVVALLERERPDVVVNAAAYTAVDRAEAEPELAQLVNAETVGAIARAVRGLDALLVHYSTDYVFDGTKAGCHAEDDPTNPLGVYGRTKLEGERLIAEAGPRHLVFRTSWVHAAHGANFVRTILRLARERDTLRVVLDQVGVPTSAPLIARITAAAIARAGASSAGLESGVYHLAPRGATTWFDFARFILAQAHDRGVALRVAPEAVEPIPTSAYPTAARRPANSLLCTAKLTAALGIELPEWQDDAAPVVAALAAEHRPLTPPSPGM